MSTTFGGAIRTLFVGLLYVAIYTLMQNVVAAALGLMGMYLAVTAPGGGDDPLWAFDNAIDTNVYLCTAVAMLLSMAAYLALGLLRERPVREELRLRRPTWLLIVPPVLLALGCRVGVEVYTVLSRNVPALTESLENAHNYSASLMTPAGLLMSVLTTVIFAPVFEEILFRGFVQTELMRGFPPAVAIAVGALIFGASHGVLFQSLFAAVIGLIFGWCYYVTKNLLVSMVIHSVFNATSALVLFVPEGGAVLAAAGAASVALILLSCVWIYKRRERI